MYCNIACGWVFLVCEQIKALVQHGGNFLRNAQGSIEYVGGETRLITLPTLAALKASAQGPFKMLQGQLKGTLGAVSDGTDPFQVSRHVQCLMLPCMANMHRDPHAATHTHTHSHIRARACRARYQDKNLHV